MMAGGEDHGKHPYGGSPRHMTANRHLTEQGQTSPSAGHRQCSDQFLLYVVACVGLLLHRDADLFPLTGSGLPFSMR
jgi:hypothetical protein